MADQYAKRVDSTQLPSATELLDILTKESQRKAIHFDFIKKNNSIFDIHRQLSVKAGSDGSWIDRYEHLSLEELAQNASVNHAELARYIEGNPSDAETYSALYNALIPQAQIHKSDATFVFGAATNARIERAIGKDYETAGFDQCQRMTQ